jgi:SOS-response transcriptional repressor LexA
MVSIDRERLRQRIAERQTTARAVSRAIGQNDTLVRDILSGKSRNARGDTMAKIAEHLEIPVSELMTGIDAPIPQSAPELMVLPVRGVVQAGAWIEAVEDLEPEELPAARDPRFPKAAQWLSIVRGDSMNALEREGRPAGIYDGDLVHCVDAVAIHYEPRTGDVVEVERIRFQGREHELTLKQVEVTPRGILLWPRSSNARWQEPIAYREGDQEDVEVRIRGWVITSMRRF